MLFFSRSWLQTCSRSPGGPGCVGAAPCPGAPGEPAACVGRRVSRGPGLGWSDAGGSDLHPWVPHKGDSTLSHQHTATSSTKRDDSMAEQTSQSKECKTRTGVKGKLYRTHWDGILQHCARWTVQIIKSSVINMANHIWTLWTYSDILKLQCAS